MLLPESTNGSTKPVARQSGLRAHVSYGSKPAVRGMSSASPLPLNEPTSTAATFAAGQWQKPTLRSSPALLSLAIGLVEACLHPQADGGQHARRQLPLCSWIVIPMGLWLAMRRRRRVRVGYDRYDGRQCTNCKHAKTRAGDTGGGSPRGAYGRG